MTGAQDCELVLFELLILSNFCPGSAPPSFSYLFQTSDSEVIGFVHHFQSLQEQVAADEWELRGVSAQSCSGLLTCGAWTAGGEGVSRRQSGWEPGDGAETMV